MFTLKQFTQERIITFKERFREKKSASIDLELAQAQYFLQESLRQAVEQSTLEMEEHCRPFYLLRQEDTSGVSGLGIVADGVTFPDGVTVLHWRADGGSTTFYASLEGLESVHGHSGRTKIIFIRNQLLEGSENQRDEDEGGGEKNA